MSLDLAPARWIWPPMERTLPNTTVLFRREITVASPLRAATGWLLAESRYRLTVDGIRIQWGPAPADPRWPEADPLDLLAALPPGRHCIGVEVHFFGHGDGSCVPSCPGLLLNLELVPADGSAFTRLVSDDSWHCHIDRARPPGRHAQWFLRALQEIFDARLHPHGWDRPGHDAARWLVARPFALAADKPIIASPHTQLSGGPFVDNASALAIRPRSIPPLREHLVPATLREQGRVRWHRSPDDWFDLRVADSFTAELHPVATTGPDGALSLPPSPPDTGWFLTFALPEQMAGWPVFEIEAPDGTIVEWLGQESHAPGRSLLLDTHYHTWVRFTCREGLNSFETFDYFGVTWMQLHIRNPSGPVRLHHLSLRRRVFAFPHPPAVHLGDPTFAPLLRAAWNTLHNSAQEIVADGVGRERQQYSGDVSHQLEAVRYATGDWSLARRFLVTYGQGLTLDGYFLDCWPGYDRLHRLAQRQLGATGWGPILDHGVEFVLEAHRHHQHTGAWADLAETYPRLVRFARYLAGLIRPDDGLLPVEHIGVPSVWMDHEGFRHQADKQCAFNLYVVAALRDGLAPLAHAAAEPDTARWAEAVAARLHAATIRRFWHAELGVFTDNLPRLATEDDPRHHDRTLATALLHDLNPDGQNEPSLRLLLDRPAHLGRSYPANAVWRARALCHFDLTEAVLAEWRTDWLPMPSIAANNTLAEFWHPQPDTHDEWSHCAVSPLFLPITHFAGIRPGEPGFATARVRPALGLLPSLEVTAHTVRGPLHFHAVREADSHLITVTPPADVSLVLEVPPSTAIPGATFLENIRGPREAHRLPPGQAAVFRQRVSTFPLLFS